MKDKLMNEEKVLKKLKIKDFRHLSKEKVVDFISMLPEMDPEVAKAAIGQFPEFTSMVKSITADYKDQIKELSKSNDDSMKSCYEAAKNILKALDKMLKNKDLSYDEKMEIITKMQEIQKMMNEKDSENKKFIRDIASIAGVVIIAVAGAAATLLGGNIKGKD